MGGGVDIEGAALFLAGDLLSGDIHEELRKTNADTIAGGIAYWIDPLSQAVAELANTYGRVTVDVVAGNHGRNPLNRRSPAKGRARDNFDTLIGWLIARDFAADPRVDVHVEESTDAYRTIYNHRYLINHGDSAKGGSGIAGAQTELTPPPGWTAGFKLLTARLSGTAMTFHDSGGAAFTTGTAPGGALTTTGSIVGGRFSGTGAGLTAAGWTGDIAAVLAYDTALSLADMDLVGDYLTRWGLPWTPAA